MVVAFTCLSNRQELKKGPNTGNGVLTNNTSSFLKETHTKSIPGALLFLREKKTFWISSSLFLLSRLVIWDEDNRWGRTSQKREINIFWTWPSQKFLEVINNGVIYLLCLSNTSAIITLNWENFVRQWWLLTELKKKLKFLSPRFSHWTQDFCLSSPRLEQVSHTP